MRGVATSILGGCVLLLAGCGGGDDTAEPVADAQPADETDAGGGAATDAEGGGNGEAGDDGGGDPADGGGTDDGGTGGDGTAGGSYAVDGTTYEVTEVLDCSIGSEGFPDDRQFVGESADGAVRMSVSYFEDETFAGLNGADLEVELRDGTVATVTWASSYAGADAAFDITPRADGAEGAAEVGVVGPDVPDGTFTATWSFTC